MPPILFSEERQIPAQPSKSCFSLNPLARRSDPSGELIAEALQKLSLEERERIYMDVHGVPDKIEETPTFVSQQIEQLKKSVEELIASSQLPCEAITMVLNEARDYVFDHGFLLTFLRSEFFQPRRAAARLIRFMDWKCQLFGKDALCREITIADLTPQDRKTLRKGYVQWLPERDSSGRPVVASFQANQVYDSAESLGRVMYYMMIPGRGEEYYEKETVLVVFHLAEPDRNGLDPKVLSMYSRGSQDWPVRVTALHHCIKDSSSPLFQMFLRMLVKPVEKETRARVKVHQGSTLEWGYALMTFGIPHQHLPVTSDGRIKTKNHLEYLELRKIQERLESQEGKKNTILLPLRSDVLMGKGKPIQEHTGNLRLQVIVDEYLDDYFSLDRKKEKTLLSAKIVQKVKDAGCRFLSKDLGVWVEAPDHLARDKISHLFRTRRKTSALRRRDGSRKHTLGDLKPPESSHEKKLKL